MDSMELFHILYIVFLIFGILLLIAAVFEFFAFHIKKIFQDLTGITQKREIRQMTEDTEYTGQLKHRSGFKKHEMLMSPSGKLNESKQTNTTGKLRSSKKKAVITPPPASQNGVSSGQQITAKMPKQQETAVSHDSATELLTETMPDMAQPVEADTGVLNTSAGETAILNEQVKQAEERESETSVLSETKAVPRREIHFLLERQILMTHTNEVIDIK